jgi:hypothetical protein
MPNIPQYDVPVSESKFTPDSGGAMVTARAARVTQETAKSIGDATTQQWRALGHTVAEGGKLLDDYVTQRDITNAGQQHTAISAQAAQDLPKILANAADPVQAAKDYYDKTYNPALEKINEGMMTKRSRMWAAEHSQSGAQAFMRTAIGEATAIQGARAISGFQTSIDNLGAAARSDPHNADQYMKQVDSLMDGLKGTLSAQQQITLEGHRNAMKGQVALSAAHALADQNPEQFKKDLAGGWGKDVLGVKEREALIHYADYQGKRQTRLNKVKSQTTIGEWVEGKIDQQTGDAKEVTPADIGAINSNPNIHADDKPAATRFGVAVNRVQQWMVAHKVKGRATPPGDAAAEIDLRQRIGNAENPTTLDQVTDAVNEYAKDPRRGISPNKAMEIAKRLKPAKLEDISHASNHPVLKGELDRAKAMITGANEPNNGAVKDKVDTFKLDVLRQVQERLDKGQDWKALLNPKDPDYLFTPERIATYRPSPEEVKNQMVKRAPTLRQDPATSQFLRDKPPSAKSPAPDKPSLESIFGKMGGGKK